MENKAIKQQRDFLNEVLGRILCCIAFLGASAALWMIIFSAARSYTIKRTVENYNSRPDATSPSERSVPKGLTI